MARVLQRIGYAIDFPEAQTCCGQPGFNSGYWREARALAEKKLIRCKYFATPNSSCARPGSCTTSMARVFYQELC